jgi:hypothetical protein
MTLTEAEGENATVLMQRFNIFVFIALRCWYASAALPALHTQQRLVMAVAMATNEGEAACPDRYRLFRKLI